MRQSSAAADMYEYILESKGCIKSIIANRQSITRDAVDYFLADKIEQIYVIGSGTSYHAALAARSVMERVLGINVFVFYLVSFKDSERIFSKNTLVIGVSQAGKSSSTIAGIEKTAALGLKTMVCTAAKAGGFTCYGAAKLYCELGAENVGPKTKGYFASIVTLLLFALEAASAQKTITGDEADNYIQRIASSAENIPAFAEQASAWYRAHAEELKTARRIIVIAYSVNTATYMEGALKLLEALHCSVA